MKVETYTKYRKICNKTKKCNCSPVLGLRNLKMTALCFAFE